MKKLLIKSGLGVVLLGFLATSVSATNCSKAAKQRKPQEVNEPTQQNSPKLVDGVETDVVETTPALETPPLEPTETEPNPENETDTEQSVVPPAPTPVPTETPVVAEKLPPKLIQVFDSGKFSESIACVKNWDNFGSCLNSKNTFFVLFQGVSFLNADKKYAPLKIDDSILSCEKIVGIASNAVFDVKLVSEAGLPIVGLKTTVANAESPQIFANVECSPTAVSRIELSAKTTTELSYLHLWLEDTKK
jgi:hypothetical protein